MGASDSIKRSLSIGKSSYGVGSFGHDNRSYYELESRYQFIDRSGIHVTYFSLYFTSNEPVGLIKFYQSESLNDFKSVKKTKRRK